MLPKPRPGTPRRVAGRDRPSELRRVGRLADGWLPSFVTPDDAARGREVIEAALAEHDRTIDADHYGALISYSSGPVPQSVSSCSPSAAQTSPTRPCSFPRAGTR